MLFERSAPRYPSGMFRSFAIVPAAGRSARMGAPKLMLPLGDRLVIDWVLAAWTASRVTRTVVVVRADDALLLARCRRYDVDLVTPSEPPRDMKASVQLALAHVAAEYEPNDGDAWLLAPADLPRLAPAVIDQLIAAHPPGDSAAIVPVYRGGRGHPTLLPWSMARDVHRLGESEGVNAVVERGGVREIACDWPEILDDLNLPEDYDRIAAELATRRCNETAPR
jgi:molybdenum cofactor cytidylyltransferase